MSIILRKAAKTTTLADLQDRLQQMEDGGDLLVSLSTKTLDGTDFNVAALDQGAAKPPLGKMELFTEPVGMTADREAAFFSSLEVDGSTFVEAANIFIEGQPTRVVVCRSALTGAPHGGATRPFSTRKTDSDNGSAGASSTSGLSGTISNPKPNVEVIDATETLTARRRGQNLGGPKTVRQVRTKIDAAAKVGQPDYCWGKRTLPDAELIEDHPGFGDDPTVFSGSASFFGKGDDVDEGTGSPAFGTTQTNSSVFGVAVKEAQLIAEGLAIKVENELQATDKGRSALVEVFFQKTGRLIRVPIVDVGPGAKKRVIDITVAATAFLQNIPEDDIEKLDNIPIQARIVA